MKYIADISSNHCGSLEIAKLLIREAKKAGADYAKFQYWETENFISNERFKDLKVSHQADWKETVYETYKKYEVPVWWIPELYNECEKVGIEFLLSCYEISKIDEFDKYVKMWKVGSGDITYYPMLEKIASKNKPIILGCGASSISEIKIAEKILGNNEPYPKFYNEVILLKCNTNYTGNDKLNMRYLQYGTLNSRPMQEIYYQGISDHTKSDIPIIIATIYGAEYIERHFKLFDNESPDSKFSLNNKEWSNMIEIVNQTKDAMGDDDNIQENEKLTKIIQRRSKEDWKRPNNISIK